MYPINLPIFVLIDLISNLEEPADFNAVASF